MDQLGVLTVGTKMLGVYFGIHGIASMVANGANLLETVYLHWVSRDLPFLVDASVNIFHLLQSGVLVAAAFCLTQYSARIVRFISAEK